jgi:hypothetical protein
LGERLYLKHEDQAMNCSAHRQHGQKPLMEMIQAFRSDKDIAQLQIFVGQR